MWQISGLYTSTGIIPRPPTVSFANLLLSGETDGFAIDATDVSATPAYTGAPYAGYVSVKDTGTPANNLSNVNLESSNLVQSGTSPKMVLWNSSPYVRWTPHNYALQSQTFDNVLWTKPSGQPTVTANATTAPDGTSTADKVVSENATNYMTLRPSSFSITGGFVYTISVYGKAAEWEWIEFGISDTALFGNYVLKSFNVSTGAVGTTRSAGAYTLVSATTTDVGSGWYRCELVVSTTADAVITQISIDTNDQFANTVAGDGTSGLYLWGYQVNRGYTATPYLATTAAVRIGIPQEYDTAASKYGILVEPAATNLLLRSEEISNASWTKTDNTITADSIAAPDGATTADLATEGSAGTAAATQAITITGNATYTISFFFKIGNTNWVRIALYETATSANRVSNWFNLSTGAMGTPANGGTGSGATGSITSVGNGWYRCVLTGAVNNAATAVTVEISSASADGSATRVNGATYYPWGAQAETGSVASSYVPTLGSTVTRAADVIKAAKTTFPWSDTNGSIYAKYKPFNVGSGSRYVWQAYKDANNHISLVDITADPELENTQASTQDVLLDAGTVVAGTLTRVSGAYKANDFDVSQDGGAVQSDAGSTLTTGYTDLYIGTKGSATTEELSGYIYHLLYVPYQRQTVNGDIDTWKNAA